MGDDELKTVESIKAFWAQSYTTRAARLNSYKGYHIHVYDDQWSDIDEPAGDRPKVEMFLSSDIVRKYRSHLFPQSAKLGVRFTPDPEQEIKVARELASKYEDQVLDTYRENKLPLILRLQAEFFVVGGAAVLYAPHDTKNNPGNKAKTLIYSLDPSEFAFIRLGYEIVAGMHRQPILVKDAKKLGCVTDIDSHDDLEEIDDLYYFDKQKFVRIIGDSFKIVDNPLAGTGYEIPYYFIPNNPDPLTMEGTSDITQFEKIDQELNARLSDLSLRIRESILGPVTVSGDGVKKYSLDPDMVNYVPTGGKAERLAPAGDGKEFLEYINLMLGLYQRKTAVTDPVLGIETAAVASSGIAMQFKFLNLDELIQEKRLTWDIALRHLNERIIYNYFGEKSYRRNDPIYPPATPTDETQKTNNAVAMVGAGITSRAAMTDDLNPTRTPEEIRQQIEEEKKTFEPKQPPPNQQKQGFNK